MNDKRFIFFLGKGGVGKSIVSTAYAVEAAKQGKKTLLLSIRTADKVEHLFDTTLSDNEITKLDENLYATIVTPEYALEEYVMLKLKVRFVYKAVFENKIVASFLNAIPGLNDLVMLGKAYWHAIEKDGDRYVWDKVIVDAPATGHGIFFLQIPLVIADILSSGNMYEEALRMQQLLEDETTELNLVTLPEEMPINESLMMIRTANEKLNLPIQNLIVNGVVPQLFDDFQTEISQVDDNVDADQSLAKRLIQAAKFRIERVENQRSQMSEIEDLIASKLPYFFTRDLTREMVEQLGEKLSCDLDKATPLFERDVSKHLGKSRFKPDAIEVSRQKFDDRRAQSSTSTH